MNKSYDDLNRLTSIWAASSGAAALGYAYSYNDANGGNQRIQATLPEGSMWFYEYDALGQVKSGKRYWADFTPVAGQQFQYAFNDIGSRTSTLAGGDASGTSLRSAS